MLLSAALRARFARLLQRMRGPVQPCDAACRRPSLPRWPARLRAHLLLGLTPAHYLSVEALCRPVVVPGRLSRTPRALMRDARCASILDVARLGAAITQSNDSMGVPQWVCSNVS